MVLRFLRLWAPLLVACGLSAQIKDQECMACHGMKGLPGVTERGKTRDLFVPPDALKGSAHEGRSCVDCHPGGNFDDAPHWPTRPEPACAKCHSDALEAFKSKDVHGQGYQKKNPRAPYCHDCHGGHRILPLTSPESGMSREKQPATCGRCHGSEKLNLEEGITKRNLVTRYQSSVHWQAIQLGKVGASCTDCHGFHSIQPSASETSSVSTINLVTTCSRCHPNEAKAFQASPHGRALSHGNHDAPTCTTCHGDHDMASLRIRVGDAKQWAATQVCIWCHGNGRMMARYGLDTTPVESYLKDFHGLTQRGTMGASATCADCHDAHHSLPSDHPQSRMHLSNRGTACAACHGKVSDSFAMSFSHKKALQVSGRGVETFVRILYVVLILGTIGAMLAYNGLIWLWAVRVKVRTQRLQRHLNRMTRFERGSHLVLIATFLVLVVTGFALKYPEAFWARWLFHLGMTEGVRSGVHRTAGTLMCLDLLFFSARLLLKPRGREMLRALWLGWGDLRECLGNIRFYLGRAPERPRSPIFGFVEKVEVWALVWGTLIMALTGLVLWFPKALPAAWPSWILNVARLIHFYEAVLASLAILIWHGFHTIWHPDEYPMNTSWLTGYITEEEARHRFNDEALDHMTKDGNGEGKKDEAGPVEP